MASYGCLTVAAFNGSTGEHLTDIAFNIGLVAGEHKAN